MNTHNDNYLKAWAWATAYCAKSEHCLLDVLSKLPRFELTCDECDELTARLCSESYIDELRYARAFAHDKFRFNAWGRLRIARELAQKQIPNAIITEALASLSEDDYRQALRQLLIDKNRHLTANNDYERQQKLMRYAYGRGFEPDYVRRLLPEVTD